MTAVDTNVVVRLLAQDDPKQTAAARALFSAGSIWIAKTVLLETAWVPVNCSKLLIVLGIMGGFSYRLH